MKSSRAFVVLLICLISILVGWAIIAANLGTPNPLLRIPEYLPYGDKIGHFLAFGVLAGLLHFVSDARKVAKVPVWPALVLLVAFVEEFSQLFLKLRTFNWWDLLADVLGVFLATTCVELLFRRSARKEECA